MIKPPKRSSQFILLLPPACPLVEVTTMCNRSGYAEPKWCELAPHADMRRFLIYDAAVVQEPGKPTENVPDSTGQYQFCFDHKTENLNYEDLPEGSGSDAPSDQGGTPPDLEQGAS